MLCIRDERRNKRISKLIDRYRRKVAKMTPKEIRKMLKRQAKSWARQDFD